MNANIIALSEPLKKLIHDFKLPSPLGFGTCLAPIMAKCVYTQNRWNEVEIVPFAPMSFSPATKGFHYGQLIFEGMKAYRLPGKAPQVFRPEDYGKRFQKSAQRLAMPELPLEHFMKALNSVVHHCGPLIPHAEGESLYIRPLMMATGEGISLAPSSSFLFLLMVSPSASYFTQGKVTALIEREFCRAAPGGTGAAKAAGNYAASFLSSTKAQNLGFQQTLWLDAVHKQYIEEFSGMNFFALINNKLYTPELTSSILPGITRDTIIKLARKLKYEVIETQLSIDKLITQIKDGSCQEIFTCGTAAVITPLSALGETDGTLYELPQNLAKPVWIILKNELVGIQTAKLPDDFGWRFTCG